MKTAGRSLGALVPALLFVITYAGCTPAQENPNAQANRNSNAQVVQNTNVQADGQDRQKQAEAEYERLIELRTALGEIPFGGGEKEPHASLIKKHEDEVVYHEPAGQWIVRSEAFWDLAGKYKDLPIADEIAWTAAENPLPGECEGYIPCAVEWTRRTSGRYLEMFPNGKQSGAALENISGLLADLEPGSENSGTWPEEAEEMAELNKSLEELADIVAKTSGPQKDTILADIEKIRNGVK